MRAEFTDAEPVSLYRCRSMLIYSFAALFSIFRLILAKKRRKKRMENDHAITHRREYETDDAEYSKSIFLFVPTTIRHSSGFMKTTALTHTHTMCVRSCVWIRDSESWSPHILATIHSLILYMNRDCGSHSASLVISKVIFHWIRMTQRQ